MRRIKSNIDTQSAEFRTYERYNQKIIKTLHESQQKARFERPERGYHTVAQAEKTIGSGAY